MYSIPVVCCTVQGLVWIASVGVVAPLLTFHTSHPSQRLQEKHTREKLRDHHASILSMQNDLLEVHRKLTDVQQKIKDSHTRQQRLAGGSGTT